LLQIINFRVFLIPSVGQQLKVLHVTKLCQRMAKRLCTFPQDPGNRLPLTQCLCLWSLDFDDPVNDCI